MVQHPKTGAYQGRPKTKVARTALYERRCPVKPREPRSRRAFELALLGDALVRLARAFDAVLLLVAFGREHADHLVGATAVAAAKQARDDVDVIADAELMSQDSLRDTQKALRTAVTAGPMPFVMGSMPL